MMLKTTKFDPAEYLTMVGCSGVVDALGDVVRARGGVQSLAEETSLDQQIVLRAVDKSGEPDFDAVLKVMHALGVRLTASLVA